MSMIERFPNPATALAWHHFRSHWTSFLYGALIVPITVYVNLDPQPDGHLNFFILFAVAFIILYYLTEYGELSPFQRRLPVRTETLVQIELAAVLCLTLWVTLCYLVANAATTSPPESPPYWFVPSAIAIGMVCFLVWCARGSMNSCITTLGLAITCGVFAIAIPVIGPITAFPSDRMGGYLFALLLPVLLIGVAYIIAVRWIRIARHGGHPGPAAGVRIVELARSPVSAPVATGEARGRLTPKPFHSRRSAASWYDLRFLQRVELWTMMFWSCCAGMLFYTWLLLDSAVTSDTPFADFFAAIGMVVLMTRFNWTWQDQPASLPISDWSRSRYFVCLAGVGLMAGCAMLWAVHAAEELNEIENSYAISLNPLPYLGALWVGWSSLALGPGMLIGLLLIASWQYYAQPPVVSLALIACLCWLLFPVVYRAPASRDTVLDRSLPLGALVAVAAAHVLLGRFPQSPLVHWGVREALGVALVLVLLRHHGQLGSIPEATIRQFRYVLLAGFALVSGAVALWGPLVEPEQGVMAVFLSFGYIPPLFFPGLMVPHYFAWMRSRSDESKEARRKMPWMT